MSCKEIQEKLRRYSPVSGEVSLPTINRCILKNLKFTYKRLKYSRSERFTNDNMIYSQAYIDFCQTKNTQQIKFMDESGFKLTNANRTYGHSRRGEPSLCWNRQVCKRQKLNAKLINRERLRALLQFCRWLFKYVYIHILIFGKKRLRIKTSMAEQFSFQEILLSSIIARYTETIQKEFFVIISECRVCSTDFYLYIRLILTQLKIVFLNLKKYCRKKNIYHIYTYV